MHLGWTGSVGLAARRAVEEVVGLVRSLFWLLCGGFVLVGFVASVIAAVTEGDALLWLVTLVGGGFVTWWLVAGAWRRAVRVRRDG